MQPVQVLKWGVLPLATEKQKIISFQFCLLLQPVSSGDSISMHGEEKRERESRAILRFHALSLSFFFFTVYVEWSRPVLRESAGMMFENSQAKHTHIEANAVYPI